MQWRGNLDALQVVSQPDEHPQAAAECGKLRSEYVVQIKGKVRKRKDPNPRIPSGDLELAVTDVRLLNALGRQIPFLPSEEEKLSEETRLRHRILDLRCKITQQLSFFGHDFGKLFPDSTIACQWPTNL